MKFFKVIKIEKINSKNAQLKKRNEINLRDKFYISKNIFFFVYSPFSWIAGITTKMILYQFLKSKTKFKNCGRNFNACGHFNS
jgi:hypothetical protein